MPSFNKNIEEEYLVISKSPSTGCQQKYYKDDYWYKLDYFGGEAVSEELATKVLDCSDIEYSAYVSYENGQVNGVNACRSKNCLSMGQSLYSLEKVFQSDLQDSLTEYIKKYKDGKDRYSYVTDYFYEKHGVDIAGELEDIFFLDKIILNEDRHFNNIFLIYENGIFKPAPILDNGMSLFVGNDSVKNRLPIEENITKISAKPFSTSFDEQYNYTKISRSLDYDGLLYDLSFLPEGLQKSVLYKNLEICKDIIPNKTKMQI